MQRLTIVERLERWRARSRREGSCLIWLGASAGGNQLSRTSYPYVSIDGRTVGLHRWAFRHFVRELAPGEDVHHTCGRSLCWEVSHLQAVPRHHNRALGARKRERVHI